MVEGTEPLEVMMQPEPGSGTAEDGRFREFCSFVACATTRVPGTPGAKRFEIEAVCEILVGHVARQSPAAHF